jgi:hypothetical protein
MSNVPVIPVLSMTSRSKKSERVLDKFAIVAPGTSNPLFVSADIPQSEGFPISSGGGPRTAGSGLAAGCVTTKSDETARTVNGWLNLSITTGKAAAVTSGAVRHRTSPPIAMSTEIGMRNLREAASHTACRTRARLFPSASVSNPATPASRVDCHK